MTPHGWSRSLGSFVVAIAVASIAAITASAHDTDLKDPNDTRGTLDIRQVKLAHEDRPPMWTVVTFAEWRIHEIWDRGYVEILLDTRRDERPEYYALIRANEWTLEGTLWRIREIGPDSYLGTVPLKRMSGRSVSATVGLWRLEFGERRDYYRWQVHTIFTSDVCRRSCHDLAPNRAAVLQWRPGRSPSPSVSPSPSPSP